MFKQSNVLRSRGICALQIQRKIWGIIKSVLLKTRLIFSHSLIRCTRSVSNFMNRDISCAHYLLFVIFQSSCNDRSLQFRWTMTTKLFVKIF